jgi:PTS system mannose-specific IIA component
MIGIVVASHGHLAAELVSTAKQIIGDFSQVATCAVVPGTSSDELRAALRRAIASVDSGEGTLIFADLIGGSPCMQSLSLCEDVHIEVVTGVNLPMLIKACSLREAGTRSLVELALELAQYGQRNITCATAALRARVSAA